MDPGEEIKLITDAAVAAQVVMNQIKVDVMSDNVRPVAVTDLMRARAVAKAQHSTRTTLKAKRDEAQAKS